MEILIYMSILYIPENKESKEIAPPPLHPRASLFYLEHLQSPPNRVK